MKSLLRFFSRGLTLLGSMSVVLSVAACAQKPVETPPQLTYAELLATVKQTSDGGVGAYLNHASLVGLADNSVWSYGSWSDTQDPENSRSRLFVNTNLADDTAVCRQLTFPDCLFTPQEGQSVLQEVAEIVVSAQDSLYILLSETLLDATEADDEAYWQAMAQPLDSAWSLCTVDDNGTLWRAGVLQLPQEVVPDPGERTDLLAHSGFAAADGGLWLTMRRHDFSTDRGADYLLHVTPDGSCSSCTLLFRGDSSLSCGAPAHCSEDSMIFPCFEKLIVVDGLAAGSPAVQVVNTPPSAMTDAHFSAVRSADTPLWWNVNGIFSLDEKLENAARLVSWQDYELDPLGITDVFALSEEEYLAVTQQNGAIAFTRLKKMSEELLVNRPVLTLGVTQDFSGGLQRAVTAYNYTDPAFYIQTVDYSDEAAQQKGFDDARAMLADDILHGTAPDMLQYSAAFLGGQLVRQGFFADLYPYLDADAQLSRDDILPGLRAGIETDGALPLLPVDFGLTLNAVRAGAAGIADASWRTDAFRAACDALPELETPLYGYSRMDLVLQQVFTGDAFLDIAAGQCNLDSPAFCTLLEDSAALPSQRPDEMTDPKPLFANGKALAYNQYFGSFAQLQTVRYVLDGDFDLVGLPTDIGSGRALSPGMQLGIARTCQDPDAAWAFLRTLLLPDFQDALTAGFPAGTAALSRRAAAATQSRPQSGTHSISYLPPYLQQVALTQEQQAYWDGHAEAADVQKLLTVIRNTDTLYQYDSVVANIVIEEAEAFYNGQRSAEETARIIQNRVQTYLDEQG